MTDDETKDPNPPQDPAPQEETPPPSPPREEVTLTIPVRRGPNGEELMPPHKLSQIQAAKTIRKITAEPASRVDTEMLAMQLEEALDIDRAGDPDAPETMMALQMRVLDAAFGRILEDAADGSGQIDAARLAIAMRAQRQCLQTADFLNRRRVRVLSEKRFHENSLKKRFPTMFK